MSSMTSSSNSTPSGCAFPDSLLADGQSHTSSTDSVPRTSLGAVGHKAVPWGSPQRSRPASAPLGGRRSASVGERNRQCRPASAGLSRSASVTNWHSDDLSRPSSAHRSSSTRSWRRRPKTAQEKQEALKLFNQELAERLREVHYEGQIRRKAAEASCRSRCQSQSGERWKTSGACAGTIRSMSLSRTRGSTTSGLFSDPVPLASSEHVAAKELTQSSEGQDEGQFRRRPAETTRRNECHSSCGEVWKSGVCTGTFSVPMSMAGSESVAALRDRILELQRDVQKLRETPDAADKRRCHLVKNGQWRNSGACAGTVRAPSLSRKRGSTISGLFSDVQPLAGSESAVAMAEKKEHMRQMRQHLDAERHRHTSKSEVAGRSSRIAQPNFCEQGSSIVDPEDEAEVGMRSQAAEEASKRDAPRQHSVESQPKYQTDTEKPRVGSALATVRAARHGGVVAGRMGGA